MLICTVCDSNYVSSSELQFARFLRGEIIERLYQTLKIMTNRFCIMIELK